MAEDGLHGELAQRDSVLIYARSHEVDLRHGSRIFRIRTAIRNHHFVPGKPNESTPGKPGFRRKDPITFASALEPKRLPCTPRPNRLHYHVEVYRPIFCTVCQQRFWNLSFKTHEFSKNNLEYCQNICWNSAKV